MFDHQFSVSVSDQAWDSAESHAVLSQATEEFFTESGAASLVDDSRRSYRRVLARGRAIVIRGKERLGVFTNDVSPMGIGFYSPVQFFPKEKITMYFEESDPIVLINRRCMRTDLRCYSCGGIFEKGPMSPGMYRSFLDELRCATK